MDKIKIGIPRALTYYYYNELWKNFFEYLGHEVIISPKTSKTLLDDGQNYTTDEMCLSLKIYLSHVNYLKDKCDYILVPRIDDYGINDQTCTNFLSLYDLVNNTFNVKILNYNISLLHGDNEYCELMKIGKLLGNKRSEIIKAYNYAKAKANKENKRKILKNYSKLSSNKLKVIMVGHSYNLYDNYFGKPILDYLNKLDIEVIMSDAFDSKIANKLAKKFSKTLYWKYSKEAIGAIKLVENSVDGVIFLTTFPCGPDSLVNELVFRNLKKPYLNLVIDDMDSLTGIYTRIESFVDILEQKQSIK